MWLSKQLKAETPSVEADLGRISIAGDRAGVVTQGEIRSLPVYGPGGYVWQPATGETVLVIKGGTGGVETCVAGAEQKCVPPGMSPGEVYLYAPGGTSIYLKSDGTLELQGNIRLLGNVAVDGSLSINGQSCNAGTV